MKQSKRPGKPGFSKQEPAPESAIINSFRA